MSGRARWVLVAIMLVTSAPLAHAQSTNWSGFYIGANGGYGRLELAGSDGFLETDGVVFGIGSVLPVDRYPSPETRDRIGGAFGGLQAGYLVQSGQWVAGVEADFQWADIARSTQLLGSDMGPTFDSTARLNDFGTVRVRGGWAAGSSLFYATGGLAFGHGIGSVTVTPGTPRMPVAGGPFRGRDSHLMLGWVIGGGIEVALSDAVSLKAEYLHMDLGAEVFRFDLAGSEGSFIEQKQSLSLDIVRMGLNVHF